MKKIFKYSLMAVWLIFFTMMFAGVWLNTPGLWFIPESVWIFLIDATESHGSEKSSDLAFDIAYGTGFVVASIILAVFLCVRKKMN